jgi:hypothetical protein
MYSDASNINIHVGATEIARIRSTRLTGQEVCYIASGTRNKVKRGDETRARRCCYHRQTRHNAHTC